MGGIYDTTLSPGVAIAAWKGAQQIAVMQIGAKLSQTFGLAPEADLSEQMRGLLKQLEIPC